MLRKTNLLLLASTIAASGLSVNGSAEIYRWVDSGGVVNYTQQRPSDIDSNLVTTPLTPRSAQRLAEKNLAVKKAPEKPKLTAEQQKMLDSLKEKEAARLAEINRIKTSNCERAQKVLERLSAQGRIRVKAADGEERALPEDERQQRISEAQKGIATNCAG
ncbi:MAG: DUF4124 domain-containing protein [Pseudomonadales bacterium]|nr:DUF4124 domain-containing protein [Pseudomonadales bacterium]